MWAGQHPRKGSGQHPRNIEQVTFRAASSAQRIRVILRATAFAFRAHGVIHYAPSNKTLRTQLPPQMRTPSPPPILSPSTFEDAPDPTTIGRKWCISPASWHGEPSDELHHPALRALLEDGRVRFTSTELEELRLMPKAFAVAANGGEFAWGYGGFQSCVAERDCSVSLHANHYIRTDIGTFLPRCDSATMCLFEDRVVTPGPIWDDSEPLCATSFGRGGTFRLRDEMPFHELPLTTRQFYDERMRAARCPQDSLRGTFLVTGGAYVMHVGSLDNARFLQAACDVHQFPTTLHVARFYDSLRPIKIDMTVHCALTHLTRHKRSLKRRVREYEAVIDSSRHASTEVVRLTRLQAQLESGHDGGPVAERAAV